MHPSFRALDLEAVAPSSVFRRERAACFLWGKLQRPLQSKTASWHFPEPQSLTFKPATVAGLVPQQLNSSKEQQKRKKE